MDRTIKVTGTGRVCIPPDLIQLDMKAEGVCREYDSTIARSAQVTGLIREAIAQAGLDPKDLKTQDFSLNSEYASEQDSRGNWKEKFVGYKVNGK